MGLTPKGVTHEKYIQKHQNLQTKIRKRAVFTAQAKLTYNIKTKTNNTTFAINPNSRHNTHTIENKKNLVLKQL